MIRCKIFLSISAVCLAAVGIATNKIQSATVPITYRSNRLNCAIGLVTMDCPGLSQNFCRQIVYTATVGTTQISTTKYTLYSITEPCIIRLLTS